MIKLALFLACLSVIDGRIIVRVIREADVNATASDLTNATAKPSHDPPELSEFQSDLVAPASGTKPLQAKYTIRVKPKLKDGVPQIQEIRIMPPKSNATKGFVKPLMVLKQNVTRPMIENIEIDVPEKGKKFSSKPSVEVIEGDHKELLEVNKGEATVENPAQKSETKLQDQNDNTAASNSLNATSQNATTPSTSPNATVSSTSQDAPANSSTTSTQTAAVSQSTNIQTTTQTQASSSTSESAPAVAPPEAPSAASVAAPVASSSVAASSTEASPAPAAASAVASSPAAPASAAVAPAAASSSSAASPAPAAASDVASYAASPASAAVAPAAAPAVPVASVSAATAPAEASAAVADPVQAYARAYANVPQSCSDDTRCIVYPEDRCGEQWLQTNCRLKCKLCSK